MDVQQLHNDKQTIIDWINELQDYSLVAKIKAMMNNPEETSLTSEQKNAIDKALISVEKNGTKSHETVMTETKKRYPHLFQR